MAFISNLGLVRLAWVVAIPHAYQLDQTRICCSPWCQGNKTKTEPDIRQCRRGFQTEAATNHSCLNREIVLLEGRIEMELERLVRRANKP